MPALERSPRRFSALSPETSERLRRAKTAGTRPEVALRRLLHQAGYRYRVQYRPAGLPRRTIDVAFRRFAQPPSLTAATGTAAPITAPCRRAKEIGGRVSWSTRRNGTPTPVGGCGSWAGGCFAFGNTRVPCRSSPSSGQRWSNSERQRCREMPAPALQCLPPAKADGHG